MGFHSGWLDADWRGIQFGGFTMSIFRMEQIELIIKYAKDKYKRDITKDQVSALSSDV